MPATNARESLLQTVTSAADFTDKEGYAVEVAAGAVTIINAATDVPFGVITYGTTVGGHNCIALPGNVVRVKLDTTPGTVVMGTKLQVTAAGKAIADAGTGARVVYAQALESGAANELIIARLLEPVVSAA